VLVGLACASYCTPLGTIGRVVQHPFRQSRRREEYPQVHLFMLILYTRDGVFRATGQGYQTDAQCKNQSVSWPLANQFRCVRADAIRRSAMPPCRRAPSVSLPRDSLLDHPETVQTPSLVQYYARLGSSELDSAMSYPAVSQSLLAQ
jgi:hypothetical protein